MKPLTLSLSLMTLSLVAAGPLPAMAFGHAPATSPHTTLILAADDFTQKKAEYQEKAKRQMDEWGQKMNEAAEKAKENSKRISAQAQQELDRAWADTKAQWAKLQQASADGWDRARTAYEQRLAQDAGRVEQVLPRQRLITGCCE